jgi:hypothetical protein
MRHLGDQPAPRAFPGKSVRGPRLLRDARPSPRPRPRPRYRERFARLPKGAKTEYRLSISKAISPRPVAEEVLRSHSPTEGFARAGGRLYLDESCSKGSVPSATGLPTFGIIRFRLEEGCAARRILDAIMERRRPARLKAAATRATEVSVPGLREARRLRPGWCSGGWECGRVGGP